MQQPKCITKSDSFWRPFSEASHCSTFPPFCREFHHHTAISVRHVTLSLTGHTDPSRVSCKLWRRFKMNTLANNLTTVPCKQTWSVFGAKKQGLKLLTIWTSHLNQTETPCFIVCSPWNLICQDNNMWEKESTGFIIRALVRHGLPRNPVNS